MIDPAQKQPAHRQDGKNSEGTGDINAVPRPKNSRLVHKFLFFGLPILLISLLITSAVLSWVYYTYSRKTVLQNYESILRTSAEEIRYFIFDAVKSLESFASVLNHVKPDQWQKRIALNAFNDVEDRYMMLAILSDDGVKKIGYDWREISFEELKPRFIEKVMSGKTAISPVRFLDDKTPFIHIAVPIRHLGRTSEILYGKLNLKRIWDMMESLKVGDTGHVSIMDASGRFIGNRKPEKMFTEISEENRRSVDLIARRDHPLQWESLENGREMYHVAMRIQELNWVIVLQQSKGEIYRYLYRGIFLAIGLTLLFLVIAGFAYWRWFKSVLIPIRLLDNQVRRISQGELDHKITVESTDEIGDLARAFNKMTDHLKEMLIREKETAMELAHNKNLAILGGAASRVSHEVGNFLSVLHMVIMGLKKERLSEKSLEFIQIVENDSKEIRQFMECFLKVARKPEIKLKRAFIEPLIQQIVILSEPLAQQKNIRFSMEGIRELPEFEADFAKIHNVINNIIKNAMEAMPDGGTIAITAYQTDKEIEIVISDTGEGMPPETVERIFEPFFTTKGKSGTGLGLAISKTIIESHGGSIECESEVGKGTVFIIRLPKRG